MKPTLIPCMTGRPRSPHEIHLYSPTITRPLVRASKTTIVDCFTFGLKRNANRIDPVAHYNWFVDMAKELQHEDGIVLIAPDPEWLGDEITLDLASKWLSNVDSKVMPVVGSYLHSQIPFEKTVGYALNAKTSGPAHPEWTHSFSQYYKQLEGETKLWTYDTTKKIAN